MNDDLIRRAGTNLPQVDQGEIPLQEKQDGGTTFDMSQGGPGIGGLLDSVDQQQGNNTGKFNPGQESEFDPQPDPPVSPEPMVNIGDKQRLMRQAFEASLQQLAIPAGNGKL